MKLLAQGLQTQVRTSERKHPRHREGNRLRSGDGHRGSRGVQRRTRAGGAAAKGRGLGGSPGVRRTTFVWGGAGRAKSLPTPHTLRTHTHIHAQTRRRGTAERPGARAGDEPGSRRHRYGHPAAGRQNLGSVALRPPRILRAQLRLGALAVRAGRGRAASRGAAGAEGRTRVVAACSREPEPLGPGRGGGGRGQRSPLQTEVPFPPARRLCGWDGGAPGTFGVWGEGTLRSRAPNRAGFWRVTGVFPGMCPALDP